MSPVRNRRGSWAVLVALLLVSMVTVPALPAAGETSSATSAVAANPSAGQFVGLRPSRVLDTTATGIPARSSITVQLGGKGGIPPTGATSVMLTLQAVTPAASGYLTVHPAGTVRPAASQLNFSATISISNLVIAPLSAAGAISIYNSSTSPVRVIADVSGYYQTGTPNAAGTFTTTAITRILDTGLGIGAVSSILPRSSITVQLAGRGGVPSGGVADAMLNLQAVTPSTAGYLTMYAPGTPRPQASNLSFNAGTTVAGLSIAPLSSTGAVTIYNGSSAAVRVIGDLVGFHLAGTPTTPGGFTVEPTRRILDTISTIAPYAEMAFTVRSRHSGPIALAVQVVSPARAGFLTLYKSGTSRPATSNLNFAAGRSTSNLVVADVDQDGGVNIYNGSGAPVRVIVDFNGFHRTPGLNWTTTTDLDINAGKMTGLSCPTVNFCAGVDEAGNAWTYDGISWISTPLLQAFDHLSAVSCVSAIFCIAVGGVASDAPDAVTPSGAVYQYNGTSWAGPTFTDAGTLTSVSCANDGFCAAIGYYRSGNATGIVLNDSVWSTPTLIAGLPLSSISCTSRDFCHTVGRDSTNRVFSQGSWATEGNPDGSTITPGVWGSISCAHGLFCAIGSEDGNVSVMESGVVATPSPLTPGAPVLLSCPTNGFCIAAGQGIHQWTGNAWLPATGIIPSSPISAVSCTNDRHCRTVSEDGTVSVGMVA